MHLITRSRLVKFIEIYPDSKNRLWEIIRIIERNNFETCNHMKNYFSDLECIGNNRVVMNVRRNKYRLILEMHYNRAKVYVRFIGTHNEYDNINALEI